MKKLLLITAILALAGIYTNGQIPEKFNYQGVLRNSSGELVTNKEVTVQISLLEGSSAAAASYSERHSVTTSSYGHFTVIIGTGVAQNGTFSNIDWSSGQVYLKTEVDESGGTVFTELGTVQLLSVPYSIYSNKSDSSNFANGSNTAIHAANAEYADEAYLANVLGSNSVYTTSSDTLFVVKDHQGNIVFAVYPDGAKVYVNETAKGKVGGFAVSGRSPSKSTEENIFIVTSDSTRVYVTDTTNSKGKVGGFAVSGRSPSKSVIKDYLQVTKDSTRIFYEESGTKAKVGGFAVSGRSPSKAGTSSLMSLTKENYFIGHSAGANNTGGLRNFFAGYESGMMNTEGDYNVAMGYQAGRNNTNGFYNVFIGYRAGLNSNTASNVFIGTSAGLNTTNGWSNVFIGQVAGRDNTTGVRNVMIGRDAGSSTQSSDNTFIGTFTGANLVTGSDNVFVGIEANSNGLEGYQNVYVGGYAGYSNNGSRNVILGRSAGPNGHDYNTQSNFNNSVMIGYQSGYNNITGNGNVFIGFQAGYSETGANKLYISNSTTSDPLIKGDFSTGKTTLNNVLNLKGVSSYHTSPAAGDILRLEGHASDPDGIYVYNGSNWQAITTW